MNREATKLTERALALVRGREAGCFVCRRILEAAAPDGTLGDWPPGAEPDKVEFAVESQMAHVVLEAGRAVA